MKKSTDHKTELDTFDLKLLGAVQENNQLTAQQLSERVNLSSMSCLRRLKRLREAKVIVKDVSVVDPSRVGKSMTMLALVSLERERADMIDDFKRAVMQAPEIIQCHYVTGDVDFVMMISASSMPDYENFTRHFFFGNNNVRRFNTLVVMNQLKFAMPIPLDL
ncbi:Lrp/AsnC family transcriptional regulator [Paraburkholderia sp. BR13439]|uniref:Lrp/AsnC family leucine-responsive transcriptional regulator n=1 Tax=Paraburkholderia youngii TaxID=2782701 RepID=A0A7W8LHL2_9BURK|nr:Lrp/AsnC family transcriptional regulator [Paraburkholderia youngii]MBB5405774.1 Lrp/AsnC family leucine-responsive transcriptional regulator [Paraburkholderia youngii]NUX57687.1 Lrp/AsnC family transcriptional regulator [Paraburkholderia youngii]NVI09156.1 Lrp/AsnC family transcriptional regulator [Paraburkholderia youngii]